MNTQLLRPFDLDAAKAGGLLTDPSGECLWSYVAGPDKKKEHVLMIETGDMKGEFAYPCRADVLRMAPLCWCEGKPVYKGDHLWRWRSSYEAKLEVIASHTHRTHDTTYLDFTNGSNWAIDGSVSHLTWNKPKTKKSGWMNIYRNYKGRGPIYNTKEEADCNADSNRSDCVEVHWEE